MFSLYDFGDCPPKRIALPIALIIDSGPMTTGDFRGAEESSVAAPLAKQRSISEALTREATVSAELNLTVRWRSIRKVAG